jgi:hypothetical protein
MFAGEFVPLYGLYFKHISKNFIHYKNGAIVLTENKEPVYL